MEDIIKLFVIVVIVVPMILAILNVVNATFNQQRCQPELTKIQKLEGEKTGLITQMERTKQELQKRNKKYDELVRENITKQDFEELEYGIDTLNDNVYVLDQNIDTINNNFVNVYNTLFIYLGLSVAINLTLILVFAVDFFSFAVFGLDLKAIVLEFGGKLAHKVHKRIRGRNND